MQVSRRTFLSWLSAAGVAAALPIPEALLPKVQEAAAAQGYACTLDEINAIAIKHIVPGVADLFFRNDPLLTYLKKAH